MNVLGKEDVPEKCTHSPSTTELVPVWAREICHILNHFQPRETSPLSLTKVSIVAAHFLFVLFVFNFPTLNLVFNYGPFSPSASHFIDQYLHCIPMLLCTSIEKHSHILQNILINLFYVAFPFIFFPSLPRQ